MKDFFISLSSIKMTLSVTAGEGRILSSGKLQVPLPGRMSYSSSSADFPAFEKL
jgi:hypothetical protein